MTSKKTTNKGKNKENSTNVLEESVKAIETISCSLIAFCIF